jgi:hypothetical protein
MKILSFNYRGVSSPSKKLSLKRMVLPIHSDLILLQETLHEGDVVSKVLESLFNHWRFISVDAKGCSGGLEIDWNTKVVNAQNSCGLESSLGVEDFIVDLGVVSRSSMFMGLMRSELHYGRHSSINHIFKLTPLS